jgi:hypothetical protein
MPAWLHGSRVTGTDSEGGGYDSKVSRVARRYGLDGIDRALVERWTREQDRYSLRQLADYFNERVVAAAMAEAGVAPLDGEVGNTLRLLTDEDVSAGKRTQARSRLEQQGVDVARLTEDLVSYQAINRHLKERLGVDRDAGSGDVDPGAKLDSILALQNRTAVVTETKLEQLRDTDEFRMGELDVYVDVSVTCSDCLRTLSVREFFDRGGCDCSREPDDAPADSDA